MMEANSTEVPTIEEVQRATGFVSAKTCGHPFRAVDAARRQGFFSSDEINNVLVCLKRPTDGRRSTRTVTLYCPTAIARLAQREDGRGETLASLRPPAKIVVGNDTLHLLASAAAYAGVGKTLLQRMSGKKGKCPYYEHHAAVPTVQQDHLGQPFRYWKQADLDMLVAAMARGIIAGPSPATYSLERTMELTGKSKKVLRSKKRRKLLGLMTVYLREGIWNTRKGCGDGKTWRRLTSTLWFQKDSVDKYVEKMQPPAVPEGKVTTGHVCKQLGLTRQGALKLGRDCILAIDAETIKVPTASGPKDSHLFSKKSVGALRKKIPVGAAPSVVRAILRRIRATQKAANADSVEAPAAITSVPGAPRKKAGRKKGSRDPKVVQREKRMIEAWDRGEFGTNKAEAARKFGFNRPDASKLINAHLSGKPMKNAIA